MRVGDSAGHREVNTGQQIGHFFIAPISKNALSKLPSAAAAPSIVDGQHDVTVGSEKLAFQLERISVERQAVIVLSIRATVNPQQRRVFFRRVEGRRLHHHAANFGAVFTFE